MVKKENRMSHLGFDVIEQKPKTKVYGVYSLHDKSLLGRIYWYGWWREYVFESLTDIIWTETCLKELYKFLKKLKEE